MALKLSIIIDDSAANLPQKKLLKNIYLRELFKLQISSTFWTEYVLYIFLMNCVDSVLMISCVKFCIAKI